jgi:hypothetical protein
VFATFNTRGTNGSADGASVRDDAVPIRTWPGPRKEFATFNTWAEPFAYRVILRGDAVPRS